MFLLSALGEIAIDSTDDLSAVYQDMEYIRDINEKVDRRSRLKRDAAVQNSNSLDQAA